MTYTVGEWAKAKYIEFDTRVRLSTGPQERDYIDLLPGIGFPVADYSTMSNPNLGVRRLMDLNVPGISSLTRYVNERLGALGVHNISLKGRVVTVDQLLVLQAAEIAEAEELGLRAKILPIREASGGARA